MAASQKNNRIYIIKMKEQVEELDQFRYHLEQSIKDKNPPAYYNIREKASADDKEVFDEMDESQEYRCVLLDYEGEKISCLYWASCKKYVSDRYQSIHCTLKYQSTDADFIENFQYNLHLSLELDFTGGSYLNYEESPQLFDQMKKYEKEPFQQPAQERVYDPYRPKPLSPLAQKNEYCRRKYNLRDPQERGEFQRDYDRIMYSKAFRRMVDKAQIFSSVKGDHYRTRMTHTMIVCQIARSISQELCLNSDLAEAIALGHDLGHTPFGHQGERTLDSILKGEKGFEVENLALVQEKGGKEDCFPFGGFKHNYQSVRVASCLESQYPEIDGLDLSEQTLNGMWLHTKKKAGLSIEEFSDGFLGDSQVPFTLEGQVVAAADEIAQRSHDMDDAFAAKLITPEDFLQYLALRKSASLKDEIQGMLDQIQQLEWENRLFTDKEELIHSRISSILVRYFILDVCEEARKRMKQYDQDRFEKDGHRVQESLVWFSESGEALCKYLENIITKKVLNSHEVTKFDQNGSNVVLALFRAYYKNPMLLHKGTLQRIWNEYQKHGILAISFVEGKPELLKKEWKRVTTEQIPADASKRTPEQQQLLTKRRILVRGICDFISGMTDSYALNEYHQLVL